MSGEPWVVSKFWRLENCLSATLSRSQVLTDTIYPNGHYIIIGTLANAIEVLLYINNRCPRKCDLGTPIYNRCQTQGLRLSKKKLLRKFGGFKKLLYLCIRNSKERVVGSVRYMTGGWWRRRLIEALAKLIRSLLNTSFQQTEIDWRKNFSKHLVVSKTCRTFALTTRKKKQFALHWLKRSRTGAPNEGLGLREL